MFVHTSKISLKDFEESSRYKEVKAREMIRSLFSGIGNNPSKSMTLLVSELYPLDAYTLRNKINQLCFGCSSSSLKAQISELKEKGIKSIYPSTIEYSFHGAILKLSYFGKKKRIRVKRKTRLDKREVWGYGKTLDGAILGDPMAYKCIEVSSDPLLDCSNYLIFGPTHTRGETDAQSNVILLMEYLYNEKITSKPVSLHEIMDGLGFRGRMDIKIYTCFLERLTRNIERLQWAKMIISDCIKYNARVGPSEVKEIGAIQKLQNRAMKIMESLWEHPGSSAQDIAERMGIHTSLVVTVLAQLGYLGYVEGRPRGEFATLRLTSEGVYWVEHHLTPVLELYGIEEAFEEKGISYEALDKIIRPDLASIYKERGELIDPLIEGGERIYDFQEMCREARRRHQTESRRIQHYSEILRAR